MILMSGLFAEKRLFIFRGGRDRKSKTEWLERILSDKIADIPEDHYLLFHNVWEKEEWLLSWLRKNADTRSIDTIWDRDAWEQRSDIAPQALALILSTYRSAESTRPRDEPIYQLLGHDIAHTIEMVSLTERSGQKLEKKENITSIYLSVILWNLNGKNTSKNSLDLTWCSEILHTYAQET